MVPEEQKEWDKLPAAYKAAFEAAAFEANVVMMAEYDHKNPLALSRLLGQGVKLRKFNNELMTAFYKAAQDVYAAESATNPAFKKVFDAYMAYGKSQNAWDSIAEDGVMQFMRGQGAPKAAVPPKKA